jgi:hypothetical protein
MSTLIGLLYGCGGEKNEESITPVNGSLTDDGGIGFVRTHFTVSEEIMQKTRMEVAVHIFNADMPAERVSFTLSEPRNFDAETPLHSPKAKISFTYWEDNRPKGLLTGILDECPNIDMAQVKHIELVPAMFCEVTY